MRGEHVAANRREAKLTGSSPHARGALKEFGFKVPIVGIIPACAGSTCGRECRSGSSWDHPRMRGEHRIDSHYFSCFKGSSPHARGALPYERGHEVHGGIIPACAGSTRTTTGIRATSGDHPRMRGEHVAHIVILPFLKGSSPHARGARRVAQPLRDPAGIIPACAGSTKVDGEKVRHSRDHPRMRGEHSVFREVRLFLLGSSPHARGALRFSRGTAFSAGIIPACAGSTLTLS